MSSHWIFILFLFAYLHACVCANRWTDVKQEYDEYVEQSREMEAEMDATLDQKTSTIKDLRFKLTSLENENESLKVNSTYIRSSCYLGSYVPLC